VGRLLALDVGAGTIDVLVWDEEERPENQVQLILPSRTRLLARAIRDAGPTTSVFLWGHQMGGGPITRAARAHLEAGGTLVATPQAAKTFHNDLERVRSWGIEVRADAPPGSLKLRTGDLDLTALAAALERLGVPLPGEVAVAVQDHGSQPGMSNRDVRFEHYRRWVSGGGRLQEMVYRVPPRQFTRMRAIQLQVPGAWVMDTAIAACWGALCDSRVFRASEAEGALVVNLGNAHLSAFLVRSMRVVGILEHHRTALRPGQVKDLLERFRRRELSPAEVKEAGGHGVCYAPDYEGTEGGFTFWAVVGPWRRMLDGHGVLQAAPYGNMMVAGCLGLVAASRGALLRD